VRLDHQEEESTQVRGWASARGSAAVAVVAVAAARAVDHTVGTSRSVVVPEVWTAEPAVVTILVAGTLILRLER